MNDTSTTYIGLCRFERAYDNNGRPLEVPVGQILDTFEAPVACWSASAVQYDEMLTHFLPDQGYRLLRTEEVMPIEAWFQMKGFNEALGNLAAKVHNGHRFEIGSLRAVQLNQSHGMDEEEVSEPQEAVLLDITHHAYTALPDQSAIWPPSKRAWIDPKLKELLFGPKLPEAHKGLVPETSGKQPLLRTYFVADAYLRRKVTKVFDLDKVWRLRPPGAAPVKGVNGNQGNLEYRCLIKGETAEELKEVAPYLFDLTLPDKAYDDDKQVPAFHKEFFANPGYKSLDAEGEPISHMGTGVFLRTTKSFDEVFLELRKKSAFPISKSNTKIWRFWDPKSCFWSQRLMGQDPRFSFRGLNAAFIKDRSTIGQSGWVSMWSNAKEAKVNKIENAALENRFHKVHTAARAADIVQKKQETALYLPDVFQSAQYAYAHFWADEEDVIEFSERYCTLSNEGKEKIFSMIHSEKYSPVIINHVLKEGFVT